ncbi:MAG: MopE-related protein, partial [Myxococcota bacterium]
CDDQNPKSFPGAAEVCDGSDNNCDGVTDEGFETSLLLSEDFDGENPLTRPVDPWTVTALSGTAIDWDIVTSTADFSQTFPTQWLGTDGGLLGEREDSAVESAPLTFEPGTALLLQFDSYTLNDGGCPGFGDDGEELEVNTGQGWSPMVACPIFPLNSPFDGLARRITVPVPLEPTDTTARVRWHFNSGVNGNNDGWYIDNVAVYTCTPAL